MEYKYDTKELSRILNSCGECRIEIGGPKKYYLLSEKEILTIVNALDNYSNSACEYHEFLSEEHIKRS